MKCFAVDCRSIASFEDFVAAMNRGFVRHVGGEWHGNLDAFNDYLSWPSEDEYQLKIVGWASCTAALGHDAMAKWLRHNLARCHPSNIAEVRRELARAERGQGKTLLARIREIIAGNRNVHLVLA